MKLKPSYLNSFQEPQVKAVDAGSTTVLLAVCVGSAFFVVVIAAVTCYIQRRRSLAAEQHTTLLIKRPYERPLTLRKPTAVKSPGANVGSGGVVLKKSPSPTGQKSPPGADRRESGGSGGSPYVSPATSALEGLARQEGLTRSNEAITSAITGATVVDGECGADSQVQSSSDMLADKDHASEKAFQLGKLHFRLKYNYEKHALCVTIEKCVDLPPKETHLGSCDPYVKLQLLPDKQHKVKTRVLRKTQNPAYDEDFTFYGINPGQLESTILHFVVLSFDRYSRDETIGEVVFHLGHLEFDRIEKQVSLVRNISPRSLKIRSQGRGEVLVSLCYQPAANRLTVVVLKARNLPKMDITGLCDPYVKIYLLYNKQRIAKKKTHVKKRTTSPVFNESFVFDVPYNEGLENLSLEFMLLDYERVTKNEVIGKLEIGPLSEGAAQKHWQEVAASPRRQIAEWHKLMG